MEATLFGTDGGEILSMDELAELSGRFNYEFACDISGRVPRIYLRHGCVVETAEDVWDAHPVPAGSGRCFGRYSARACIRVKILEILQIGLETAAGGFSGSERERLW